jgi:hypothetical protein
MTVYYVDHINGNDGNDGLSFATRKRSLKNASIGRSSGDEIRLMETPGGLVTNSATWKSRANPGMYSAWSSANAGSPTSIYWSNHGLTTGDWVFLSGFSSLLDRGPLNGAHPVTVTDSNYFTVPIYTTSISYSGNRIAYKIENCIVEIPEAKTKNLWLNRIRDGYASSAAESPTSINGGNYSIYTSPSISYDVPSVMTSYIMQIYNGTSTGVKLVKTIPTTDLTGFRQLSFFLWQSSGNSYQFPQLSIRLCSDQYGNVPVYTFPIPAPGGTYQWKTCVVDCDNLDSNLTMTTPINSIAIYQDTYRSTGYWRISNIIACKGPEDPDCLTHASVISTRLPGDCWYVVDAVDENYISIHSRHRETSTSSYSNFSPSGTGYRSPNFESDFKTTFPNPVYGNSRNYVSTETLPLYVYNPPWTHAIANNYNVYGNGTTSSGEMLSSNDIKITGGWNRTDMSTRSSDTLTWFSSRCVFSPPMYVIDKRNIIFENCGFADGGYNCYIRGKSTNITLNNCHASRSLYGGFGITEATGIKLNDVKTAGSDRGISVTNQAGNVFIKNYLSVDRAIGLYVYSAGNVTCINSEFRGGQIGIELGYMVNNVIVKNSTIQNPVYTGLTLGPSTRSCKLENIEIIDAVYDINRTNNSNKACSNDVFLKNVTSSAINQKRLVINSTYNVLSYTILQNYIDNRNGGRPALRFEDPDGTYYAVGTNIQVNSSTDTYLPSGKSMRIRSNIVNVRNTFPITSIDDIVGSGQKLTIAKVAVAAGTSITFSAKLKKPATLNVNACLVCEPQLGIDAPIYSGLITSYNTWEELTLNIPISQSGVLEIDVLFLQSNYSSSNYIYIDDILCTQN